MKKILFSLIVLISIGCNRSKHDSVDDEYARGFFNALAIFQQQHPELAGSKLPYWEDCKRSYLQKVDLYNDWDSSYLESYITKQRKGIK